MADASPITVTAIDLPEQHPWPGAWVADRLGVSLRTTDSPVGLRLTDLVGLAIRRNPRRAHLLVSTVLAKHVPTDPGLIRRAGLLLGSLAQRAVKTHSDRPILVLGNAETATALGHCVAEAMSAPYLHSTRRTVPSAEPIGHFEEPHSHAPSHQLLPTDPAPLRDPDTTIVLVDDELSTGTTALGTIRALHRIAPHRGYVLANLIDVRDDSSLARADALAAELGTRIEAVSLVSGRVDLPPDILTAGEELVSRVDGERPTATDPAQKCVPETIQLNWPTGIPDGGRHGMTNDQTVALGDAAESAGARLAESLTGSGMVHVLGTEEFMYTPLRIADAMTSRAPARQIRFSTTTRSPVLAVDETDYAIRTRISFPSHDDPADGPGPRFAYNVGNPGTVVLVVDSAADTPVLHAPGGAVDQLSRRAEQVIVAVVPSFVPDRKKS